ncbi:MAG: lamin tail domain-containing protein [Patescibacteria group bacterium]
MDELESSTWKIRLVARRKLVLLLAFVIGLGLIAAVFLFNGKILAKTPLIAAISETWRDVFDLPQVKKPAAEISLEDLRKREVNLAEQTTDTGKTSPASGVSSPKVAVSSGASQLSNQDKTIMGNATKPESAEIVPKTEVPIEQVASDAHECDFNAGGEPRHTVLLNEIAWMGAKDRTTAEWMELRNNSGKDISLSGWRILSQDGKFSVRLSGENLFATAGFYLLERSSDDAVSGVVADEIYAGTLSNKGMWLKLLDANCLFIDEINASAGWGSFGGNNSTKQTLERNIYDFGWHISAAVGGTPKAQNSEFVAVPIPPPTQNSLPPPEASSGSVTAAQVLISEILYDAVGSDTGKEFVELYNPTQSDIDVSGWLLKKDGTSLASIGSKTEDQTIIKTGGFFLIGLNGYNGIPAADVVRSSSLPNTSATVTLYNAGGDIIDSLSYNNSVAEGEGYARQPDDSYIASPPSPRNSADN